MRVLFVSQEVPPLTGWGGIGTYVDVLSEALAREGADVHVLSAVEGQERIEKRTGGVTVHRFGQLRIRGIARLTGLPETWKRVWAAAAATRLLRSSSWRPDVVECPEWQAEGLMLSLRRSLPLVVRLHSSAHQLFPYTGQGQGCFGLDGRLAGRLEDTSARRAHVVISTRSNIEEEAQRLRLDPEAVRSIPYPVRLPTLSLLPEDAPPRVVFVGRLEPRKGPEVVLLAAPRVVARVPGVRFAFIGRDGVAPGSPSSEAWLRAEAKRLGVSDTVELLGQLDSGAVEQEMRRATVCVFPSRWESFGNVVAEASAVGRPVVTSTIRPFHDLVDHGTTGWRVPLEDVDAWAGAIIDSLLDRGRSRTMGKAGATHVARLSAPGRVAELTLSAYELALERQRSRTRATL